MKTHLEVDIPFDTTTGPACGQAGRARLTRRTDRVDCLNCQKQDSFILAKDEQEKAAHEAFIAQEPKPLRERWREGFRVCKCGNDLFRYKGADRYYHHEIYICSSCGEAALMMTETGMSF